MLRKYSVLIVLLAIVSCGEGEFTPKPRGYFRINLPAKEYSALNRSLPYNFELNKEAQWISKPYNWGDVYYPKLKARLQITYKPVTEQNLEKLLNDSRSLAYEHTVKADGIGERVYSNAEQKVHGILYSLEGDAATSTQFFVTDSTDHFLRGVLYFYASPNADSLRPVNKFMMDETIHLIETLQWQNSLP